jgi:hypothetical protein
VAQRFDALLALGEFREVASYPADFGPWRALPQRRVVLYERASPLAFDPAAPPPPLHLNRVPSLGLAVGGTPRTVAPR